RTAPRRRARKDTAIPGPLPATLELVLGDQIYIAKENLTPRFAIGYCVWQRFKTRSFIARRPCVFRPMTSQESLLALKIIRSILAFREVAWMKCGRLWSLSIFNRSSAMNVAPAFH